MADRKFKDTEVGRIPVDWEVTSIYESSRLSARIGWQGLTTKEYMDKGEYYLVTGTDFTDGKINWSSCKYVSEERYNQDKNIQLNNGDVLVSKDGTIGKVAFVDNLPKKATLNSGIFVIRPLNDNYYPLYLNYIMNSKVFIDFLEKLSAGSTINHLYQKDFLWFKFPLPPLPEQKAIAKVLSDIDELIESMEKLIHKKKQIKQGAMQELLTGKNRLAGFSGKWEVKRLEDMCLKDGLVRGPFGGALKKEYFVDRGYKVYEQRNAIYQTVNIGEYYIDEKKFNELKRFEVKAGDFIVSCSGTIGKIFQIPKKHEKGIINQALLKIRLDSTKVDNQFFYHYFSWDRFQAKILDNTQGGAMKNIVGMSVLKNITIPLPPLPEQKAIAQILSDMDAEIEALEKKLDKYKKIKEGMMEKLLTGQVRLV